jgi:hypothetical protein
MRHAARVTRRLAVLALASVLASAAAAPPARATFWGQDFNISGSDVNVTQTPFGNQRFTAADDSSNFYVAFHDDRNKVVGGDDNFEIYFRRFTFNFGSPSITRVTNYWNMSKYPSIATLNWGAADPGTVADSGRVYLAWQDARLFSIPASGEPKSYTIYFRTYQSRGGVGFGPEIQVSPYDSVNQASSPVLAADPSQKVWIVWFKSNGGQPDLYYAVYDAVTRTMGPVQQLTNDPANSSYPTIAAARDGVVHVAWVDTRSGKQQIWTKRYVPGTGWTPDEQLVFSPSAGVASQPSLIATYTGHLHLVWRDSRDGNYDIYYKEYMPGTGWDPVDVRLTTDGSTQAEPQVDADPTNNVYVVWTDLRAGSNDPDIYFQERVGNAWQPEIPLVYAATDTTNSKQHFPGICHDGTGNTYVVWTDERLPASNGRNEDVYYKVGSGSVTAVETPRAPPLARLLRNYPNPFNPVTRIEFAIPGDAQVSLRVYDARGRLVRTLVDGYLAAGRRTVEWDGRTDNGDPAASGTYFMRLVGGGEYLTRSISLLK